MLKCNSSNASNVFDFPLQDEKHIKTKSETVSNLDDCVNTHEHGNQMKKRK